MRTTLTLDDDVSMELERLRRERNEKLRTIVNEALRAGLLALRQRRPTGGQRYRTEPISLGPPRLPNLDNIAEVLAIAEGDDRR
jgi:hypothetical protein